MTNSKLTLLALVAPLLYGCAGRLVELKLDSGVDSSADTGTDTDTNDTDTNDTDTNDTDTDSGDTAGDSGDTAVNAAPFVISMIPLDGATDVATTTPVTATFSEPMDLATLNTTTFTLDAGAVPVLGVVTYDGGATTATFTPDLPLTDGVQYTATVTTGAQDVSGLAMSADFGWEFTTATADLAPTVIATIPLHGEIDVSVDADLTATFSESMDRTTINDTTFILDDGSTSVLGVVTYDASTNTATFNPDFPLADGALYTATVTSGVQDRSGQAMAADHAWDFTTAVAPVPPTVIDNSPADGATDVSIDASPTATFSTGMDPATVNDLTFTLDDGSTSILGVVTLDGSTNIATFTPDFPLADGVLYTATVTTGVQDLSGDAMAADFVWDFTTSVAAVPPTVLSTIPIDGALDVPVNTDPSATFSTAMDPTTINDLTFTMSDGTTPIPGVVTYDGATDTATFTPDLPLSGGVHYAVTVTNGVQDASGLAMTDSYVWDFTTVSTPPTVILTSPVDGGIDVPVNTDPTATFSTAMDPTTINDLTFTLDDGTTQLPGVVTYDVTTDTATFTPDEALDADTFYTATVTNGVTDSSGLAMTDDYVWEFTTAPATAPTVLSTVPVDGATEVSVNEQIAATFDMPMESGTINDLTFTVTQGATTISGSVTYDDATDTATFTPDTALDVGFLYTVTITTGAESLTGAPLAEDATWSFTTSSCSMAPMDLGGASSFAALAGSTVTNTGLTVITGDAGVSPGTAITGFPPGVLTGSTHAADPTAATGIADLTTAYNDAAGRTLCSVGVAGNLGGSTLTPGLYTSTSSLEISTGDLTLDAGGDADAVFIFQVASTLTTTSGRQVILTNGAKATNVYWQVGDSATLGSTSAFVGTIMAYQSVTLETGASLDGRALAIIAAVTLDTNVVTTPSP